MEDVDDETPKAHTVGQVADHEMEPARKKPRTEPALSDSKHVPDGPSSHDVSAPSTHVEEVDVGNGVVHDIGQAQSAPSMDLSQPSGSHDIGVGHDEGASGSAPESTSVKDSVKWLHEDVGALTEEQKRTRFNMYTKVRENLRKEFKRDEFVRMSHILGIFEKPSSCPEPDTFVLIATCLDLVEEDGEPEKSQKWRRAALKLRGEELDDSDPILKLKEAISEQQDDLDLVTSADISKPEFSEHSIRNMANMDGVVETHFYVGVTIALEIVPNLPIRREEVAVEEHELCDAEMLDEEIQEKANRMRRKAAAKALRKLQELATEARDMTHAMQEEDMLDEEHEHESKAFHELKGKVLDQSGPFQLMLQPNTILSVNEKVDSDTLSVEVTVPLHVYSELPVELPPRIQCVETSKFSSLIVPGVRKRRVIRLRNRAASRVMQELENWAEKLKEHAKKTFASVIAGLPEELESLEAKEAYRTTLNRVKELVVSGDAADMYGCKVNVFGSVGMGLALPGSDLDLNLELPDENLLTAPCDKEDPVAGRAGVYPHKVEVNVINFLTKMMKKGGMVKVEPIPSARVPLLKFVDPRTRVHVDLTVGNEDGAVQVMFLKEHLHVDERIFDLTHIVRYWAKCRGVSKLVDGFINPLGWTVMVIYFCQHILYPPIGKLFEVCRPESTETSTNVRDVKIQVLPWESSTMSGRNDSSLSELVVEFFQFYSTFAFNKYVISVNIQGPKLKSDCEGDLSDNNASITIEQPLIKNVNLVRHVQAHSLDKTVAEMKTALFRMTNIGIRESVFDEPNVESQQSDEEML